MSQTPPARPGMVCIAQITGVHGVRGTLRIRAFLDNPEDILTYNSLVDASDKPYHLTLEAITPKGLLMRAAEIKDRTKAESLKGLYLYAARSELSNLEGDEYYCTDLVGAKVYGRQNVLLGTIKSVENYGAGDILEIKPEEGSSFMIPFHRDFVADVRVNKEKPSQSQIKLADDFDLSSLLSGNEEHEKKRTDA